MQQQQQVRCAHILQKHIESRNPIDRFRNKQVTRKKEEAINKIKEVREQLMKINDAQKMVDSFMQIAFEISECSSAQQGGDLGLFGKGQMQEAFEKAAFALQVGQVSQLVDSDSGIHIILRLE